MSSFVRSVLGAAVLLTSASTAMAQSVGAPVANQPVQARAAVAVAAPNTAPVAYQPAQAGAPTAVAASNIAPVAAQPPKSSVSDKADLYGGHDPNSLAGSRAFWEQMNPY